MANRIFLPKRASRDVRALLTLDKGQLLALSELFGEPESLSPLGNDFLEKVVQRLQVSSEVATSAVLVAQFFLSVVEEGEISPEQLFDDIRYFAQENDGEIADLEPLVVEKRDALFALVTPKASRARAKKIRYLQGIHPTTESFRSVCELRPLFEKKGDDETIVGFVPAILIEVIQKNADGEESKVVLNLSSASLAELAKVLKRTEAKLAKIRDRFKDQILEDSPSGASDNV